MDTNILLYAVSSDPAEAAKGQCARSLLLSGLWCWSAQVAAEFLRAGTARRKAHPLPLTEARLWLQSWSAFPLCSIDLPLVMQAAELSARYQISHFDAQIIAAAKRMDCDTVYSEDLNHGQSYDGVRVLNPFLGIL